MRIFNLGSLLVISLSFVMFGCTRPDKETSSFSLSVPQTIKAQKASTLGAGDSTETQTLTHVIINVSSGDKLLKTQSWDSCRHCKTKTPIPDKLDIGEFDSGPDRVVQVLGVYEGSSGGSFYYGEAQKSFDQPLVEISIDMKAIGTSSMKEGRITGRYLTTTNSGPTGDIEVRFLPPDRKSMLLMTSPIVNGWFNFMIFSDVQFSYQIREPNGTITQMFQNVNLNSPVFNDLTKPMARIEIPDNQKIRYGENNQQTLEDSRAEAVVVGWFGDSAALANKKVCYPRSRVVIDYRKQKAPSTSNLFWDPAAAPNDTVVTVKGGTGYTSTPPQGCAAGDHYNTALYFDSKRIDYSHEGFAGARASFKVVRGGSPGYEYDNITSVTYQAGENTTTPTLRVGMKLLPGVTASLFDGFNVYKTSDPDFDWHEDGVPCNQLAENKVNGFSKVGGFGLQNSSSDFSFDFQANISGVNGPDVKMIALCPYKGTVHYNGGVFLRSHALYPQNNGNGGGGGGSINPGNPPAQLRISKYYPRTLHMGGCTSFNAYFVDASGNRTGSSNIPVTFRVKNGGSSLTLYGSNDWNCSSTPLGTSATIQAGTSDFNFNVNLPAAQANLLVEVSPLPTGFSANPVAATDYNYRDPNSSTTKRVNFVGSTLFPGGICTPFIIQVTNYQGQVKTADANWTLNLSNSNPAFKIYDSASCVTEVTNLAISSGAVASRTVWGKFESAATNTYAEIVYSSSTHQIDEGGFSAIKSEIIANAPPTAFGVMSTPFKEGVCQPFFIMPMHDGNNPQDKFPVVAPANINDVILSVTQISPNTGAAGEFYTDATCNSALSSFVFSSGQSVRMLYFKPTSQINGNFQITASGFSPSQSQYYIQQDVATKLELTLLDSGLQEGGTCVPLILSPKNDANQLSQFNPGRAITFSTNQGGDFHLSPNCNNPINNGGTNRLIDVRHQMFIYYKTPTTISSSVTFSMAVEGSPSLNSTILPTNIPENTTAGNADDASLHTLSGMYAHGCYPLLVRTHKGGSSRAVNSTLTLSLPGGLNFYSDPECMQSHSSSASLNQTASLNMVFVKASTAGDYSNSNFTILAQTKNTSLIFQDPGAASAVQIGILAAPPYPQNSCLKVTAKSVSNKGLVSPLNPGSPVTIDLATTAMTNSYAFFASENACKDSYNFASVTGSITSMDWSAGATSITYYYKQFSDPSPPTLSANATYPNSIATPSKVIATNEWLPYLVNNFHIEIVESNGGVLDGQPAAGNCERLKISRKENSTTIDQGDLDIKLVSEDGAFLYTDLNCTSGPAAYKLVHIPSGSVSAFVSVRSNLVSGTPIARDFHVIDAINTSSPTGFTFQPTIVQLDTTAFSTSACQTFALKLMRPGGSTQLERAKYDYNNFVFDFIGDGNYVKFQNGSPPCNTGTTNSTGWAFFAGSGILVEQPGSYRIYATSTTTQNVFITATGSGIDVFGSSSHITPSVNFNP